MWQCLIYESTFNALNLPKVGCFAITPHTATGSCMGLTSIQRLFLLWRRLKDTGICHSLLTVTCMCWIGLFNDGDLEEVLDGIIVYVLKPIHWELKSWLSINFRCAQCFRVFPDGIFYEFEGRKYCERDFQVLFAPCCGKCGNYHYLPIELSLLFDLLNFSI